MSFLTNRLARLLFAIPFGIIGIIYIMNADDMILMLPEFLPGGLVWIYLTGIAFLLACTAVVARFRVRLAGLLLALLLIFFAVAVHLPAVLNGAPNALHFFLKDLSLAGGSLILAGLHADEPLFE